MIATATTANPNSGRSKLIRRKDLTTAFGREGLEDGEADQFLDEADAAVGEQEIGAAGMHRPVLVAMGQARRGIGPVPFAGVRQDQRTAPFGVEPCLGLKRHQRNSRISDGAGPTRT